MNTVARTLATLLTLASIGTMTLAALSFAALDLLSGAVALLLTVALQVVAARLDAACDARLGST